MEPRLRIKVYTYSLWLLIWFNGHVVIGTPFYLDLIIMAITLYLTQPVFKLYAYTHEIKARSKEYRRKVLNEQRNV